MASTRFSPPRIGSKTVRRADLLTHLERMRHATLALVTGSAGYGKTTLLAQWRERCVKAGADVAWLSLSADEADYAAFCATLFMAMQRVGLRAEPELLFDDANPAGMDALVAMLVDGVLDLSKDIYVFIDDYHLVDAPLVHRFMQKLLDQAPGTLHVVIASRVAPPFALSRLRMTNQLAELDSTALPFGMAETRSFVGENLGTGTLHADDLRLIQDVTGGWPSCVQLIVIMLKNRPASLGTLRDLAWRHGDLQAYLSEEVMANLPAELVAFAGALSLFRRFSAPLARHVTGNANARDLLKRMEDENLLINRIDCDERLAWYRFHPLFGDFLAARLVAADPSGAQGFHLRASRWFAEHGYLAEAVRHASAGGDDEFAATVIESAEPATWSLEYLSPMLHLLERLPEATLVQHRRLLFIACLTVALTTRPGKAAAWLTRLESGDITRDPALTTCIPLIHAAIAFQNDDTPRMLELLEPLRDVSIDNPFLRYLLAAELCVAYAAAGRYADARRQLDLRPVPPADRDNDMALVVESARVAALLGEGDVREAERLGTPLLARSVNAVGRHSISANICASVLVDAYYELDRIDDARETIANRLGLLRASGPDITIRASLCRARLDLLQVSASVALSFLEGQTAHLRNAGQPRAVAYMLAQQINILMLEGNTARAAELDVLLGELARSHDADQGIRAEIAAIDALARARVLRATQPERALDALCFVKARAEALGRGRLVVLACFLAASVFVELGRVDEAKPLVVQAVEHGARLGLVRTFIDERATTVALFERALAGKWFDDAAAGYVVRLLEKCADSAGFVVANRSSPTRCSGSGSGQGQPSLAAAARRVHLSQPALTRSIQALEAQAGLPLCERGPRGVKLNAAGQMVAERARRILFETNSLARDLVLLQQHEVGSVDFGLGPLPAAIMLPEVLCTLNRDWPGLRVNAEVNEGEALVESLRTERLDFVVVEHRYAPLSAELKIHRLPVEPAGCFVRPQHPLLAGEMTVERLRQAALACVRAPHSAQQRMREVLGCLPGENLRFQVVTNDFHALVHVTRRSDLVLLSPTRAVQNELQTGSLVQLTVPAIFNLSAQFAVVSLTQRALSPSAQRAIVAIEAASGSTASASFPEQPA